jgi:hypothetical protein
VSKIHFKSQFSLFISISPHNVKLEHFFFIDSTNFWIIFFYLLLQHVFFLISIQLNTRHQAKLMQTSWSRGHATHSKIEIWSRKAERGLIGVWHNGNQSHDTNTIGMSRMMPRSQLIFDKSDSIRSRTEECKNHSHTLKLKNSEVIIIKSCRNFGYMSLNSSWKIKPLILNPCSAMRRREGSKILQNWFKAYL